MEMLDRQQQRAARAFTLAEAVELFRRLRSANDDGDGLTVDGLLPDTRAGFTFGERGAPAQVARRTGEAATCAALR